jgi:hypothetical protein
MISAEGGYYFYATMRNFSRGGMCFESVYPIQNGSQVNIEVGKPFFKAAPNSYRANVVWCRELDPEESRGDFGIGVKFF